MKKSLIKLTNLFVLICFASNTFGQLNNNVQISEIKWESDFNIHIEFSNDSTSIYDVKALHHSTSNTGISQHQATYYPVNLDEEFINSLINKEIETFIDSTNVKTNKNKTQSIPTLWGSIHNHIDGGWIHFINCLVYAFEANHLSLTAPLMKRPESDWKPSPITESYKRTKKWNYYAPADQKLAIKEYKTKEKNNQLGDITLLPENFVQTFLNTDQKNYLLLEKNRKSHDKAVIDMVKLLVGSNYLGIEQIDYISNSVIKAVHKYNSRNLPSVIIFDDFEAAVAMSLNSDGYQIDKITFNNEAELTEDEIDQRIERMEGIIKHINEINKKVFEKKLKNYYE